MSFHKAETAARNALANLPAQDHGMRQLAQAIAELARAMQLMEHDIRSQLQQIQTRLP